LIRVQINDIAGFNHWKLCFAVGGSSGNEQERISSGKKIGTGVWKILKL